MIDYLGLGNLIDVPDTVRLLFRLALTLCVTGVIVRSTYRRRHSGADHSFTYWLFALVTFSIAFLLRKVPMELGFALGLFAVFGVLRYRTESIAVRDLTYLFVVIGLSLINALVNKKISLAELLIVNAAIAGGASLLEAWDPFAKEDFVFLLYDRVEWIGRDCRQKMMEDIRARTGLPVRRVSLQRVDLLRHTAEVVVFIPRHSPELSTATLDEFRPSEENSVDAHPVPVP